MTDEAALPLEARIANSMAEVLKRETTPDGKPVAASTGLEYVLSAGRNMSPMPGSRRPSARALD